MSEKDDPKPDSKKESEPEQLSAADWLRSTGLANQHSNGRPFGK